MPRLCPPAQGTNGALLRHCARLRGTHQRAARPHHPSTRHQLATHGTPAKPPSTASTTRSSNQTRGGRKRTTRRPHRSNVPRQTRRTNHDSGLRRQGNRVAVGASKAPGTHQQPTNRQPRLRRRDQHPRQDQQPQQRLRTTDASTTTTTARHHHPNRSMEERTVRNHPQQRIPRNTSIEPRNSNKTKGERTNRAGNDEMAPQETRYKTTSPGPTHTEIWAGSARKYHSGTGSPGCRRHAACSGRSVPR